LYRSGNVIRCIAVLFILALASSLVSLPFASNKCKSSILNTVEEEAAGSNTANEEHKSGKNLQCHLPDFSEFLAAQKLQKVTYVIPYSVVILSSNHCQKVIQPPDNKA
jgi:hypothetical protein